MKRLGVLIILLRGINQGFWSHLECSLQNATIFGCQSMFIHLLSLISFTFLVSIPAGLSSLIS